MAGTDGPEQTEPASVRPSQQEELPTFEEFDRPTRRGSLVPVALPRNLKRDSDEASWQPSI